MLKAKPPETDLRSALKGLKMEPEGQQSPRTELSFLLPDPRTPVKLIKPDWKPGNLIC